MNTAQISTKSRARSRNRLRSRGSLRGADREASGNGRRSDKSGIQWPSARELKRVSTTLTKVNRLAMRREEAGDYFNSGDLAFQLQEILRATAALRQKSQRIKT